MTEQLHTDEPAIAPGSPVVSSAEIEINAPIDRVWAVLTTIDLWPAWNPDVKSVSIDGPVAEGSIFRWKAGPGTITSRVEHVGSPARHRVERPYVRDTGSARLAARGEERDDDRAHGGVVRRVLSHASCDTRSR